MELFFKLYIAFVLISGAIWYIGATIRYHRMK